MIKLKDLLMEADIDGSLYNRFDTAAYLDFGAAAKNIDSEIAMLKEKKQQLAKLKVEANKLWRTNNKIERLSHRQMENPKWEQAEGQLNQDLQRFQKKLKDLGFGDITLDWRWSGVK